MAFNIFGYSIKKSEKEKRKEKLKSFVPPQNDDGAITIEPPSAGGAYGAFLDLDTSAKSEYELITHYRELSHYPDVDSAIDDIVNEAIVQDDNLPNVKLSFKKLKRTALLKRRILDSFEEVLNILDWRSKSYELFRRWYIDGRLPFHILVDPQRPKDGIMEARYIDPRQLRKVRVVEKVPDPETGVEVVEVVDEYYLYNQSGLQTSGRFFHVAFRGQTTALEGIRVPVDSVVFVHSGIFDKYSSMILSHLHKAIKPINQLKMMEDALVIYRIARAPERRIFYIATGNMPKHKADTYVREMMERHKNKIQYNIDSGEVRSNRRFLSMLEDYWIPRPEGGTGTQIETLPGGENLGEIADITYFQKKVYQALNVPISRLDPEDGFQLGRAAEITRDELKFSKFIHRLRRRFSELLAELLKHQLILKGIINSDDWTEIKESLEFDFANDNHFAELKNSEIIRKRLELIQFADQYVHKYFSGKWVKDNILRQTEEEQKQIEKEIAQEEKKGLEFGEDDDDEKGKGGPPEPEKEQESPPPPKKEEF